MTGCPRGAGSLSREQQAGDQRPRFQVRKLGWSGRPVSEGVSAEIRMQASRQRSHSLCQGLEAGTGEACRGPAGGHALGLVGGGQVPQTSQPCQGRGLVLGGRTNTCGGQKEKPVPHGRLPTGQAPVADLTPPLSSGFMAEFLHLRRELQGSSLVVTPPPQGLLAAPSLCPGCGWGEGGRQPPLASRFDGTQPPGGGRSLGLTGWLRRGIAGFPGLLEERW